MLTQRLTLSGFSVVASLASFGSLTTFSMGQASMFPPNDLYKEDGRESAHAGITEPQMDEVMSRIKNQYASFAQEFKGELVVVKHWNDREVNAYSGRDGKEWQIHFFGGLARRKEITQDAFTIVACHEAGHLFGGYPFYKGDDLSSEGQADYFATHNCTRGLWALEAEENAKHVATVDAYAKKSCDAAWTTDVEKHLCYRIADGSRALGNLLATMEKVKIDFATPDAEVVKKTIDEEYPSAQCRLDTYLVASLCKLTSVGIKIPGFVGIGKALNDVDGEALAYQESCAQKKNEMGFRPNCWFAPLEK